jgi:hypothetical protein
MIVTSPVYNSYPIPMRKFILLLFVFSAFALMAQDHRSSTNLNPVQQDDKWGYADDEGRTVIKPQFSLAHGFSDGLALVWKGGAPVTDPAVKSFVKMGYIDQKGHWVIHSRFTYYFYYDFSEDLVSFRQLSKGWGYMDPKGKIAIGPRFQWAGSFANGIAPVLLDNRCAHIDKTGHVIDKGQSPLPRHEGKQDRNGTFPYKPRTPPCS